MGMVRYPLPITAAMLTPANEHAAKPRYTTAGAADWHGGSSGNDVDVAEATQAVANSHSAAVETDYEPQHQEEKGSNMVPPLKVLGDIGKDYGAYANLTGRRGPITPLTVYPDANSVPVVTGVSPAKGPAAGATPVTLSGMAFTGATAVSFGGTAATAVVVVDANTITCTAPAHAAGAVDVRVTTPKGQTPAGLGGYTYT